jgi:hypothetical protein
MRDAFCVISVGNVLRLSRLFRLRRLRRAGDPIHVFHDAHGFHVIRPLRDRRGSVLGGLRASSVTVGVLIFTYSSVVVGNKLESLFYVEGGTPMAFG